MRSNHDDFIEFREEARYELLDVHTPDDLEDIVYASGTHASENLLHFFKLITVLLFIWFI